MKKRYILLVALLGTSFLQTQAQLDRTVVVENIYNPDIMNANKINVLPTPEEPQTNQAEIEYATALRPVKEFDFSPMANWGTTPEQEAAKRGYLRAGYGTGGNVDARLHYLFDLSKNDKLNASFSLRGMNGTIDLPSDASIKEWDARSYRTRGRLDWLHRFEKLNFGISAEGESQVFNYIRYSNMGNNHQHNTLGSLQATISSNDHTARIRFKAGTGVLYGSQKYAYGYWDDKSERYSETIIRTNGLVTGDINETSSINIAAQMDNVFIYAKGEGRDVSYTSLQLNPYYLATGEKWKARIGAHIDPLLGNGHATCKLAPDLYGEYTLTKDYLIYAQVDGGRQINDFRRINQFNPYSTPYRYKFNNYPSNPGYYARTDTYTPINGQLGVKAHPVKDLNLRIFGGYRMSDNELFCSQYTTSISASHVTHACLMQGDATAVYAGATAQYTWKDIFTTQAELEWNKWDSDILDKYPTLHPEMSLHWSASLQPVKNLRIGLDYKFEQRCKTVQGERPDAMNNLGATVSYQFLPWLTAYVQGDNLLNQKYYQYILYPAQGFNALIGVAMEF